MKIANCILLIACAAMHQGCGQNTKNSFTIKKAEQKPIVHHDVDSEDTAKTCKCPAQFELSDSLLLTHIKDEFYKSQTGHLYENTIGLREVKDHLTEVEYFNGYFC
ncbi:hypothetical protein QJ048_15480 [Pinibacter sp. MAH-24]|uniref:Uncharacterized protein n=2 Tax=Pinibacter soli TaxID=3044211 RepID=A0ABT6RFL9_9BACT|nr:hypothetical protein [Pinibacter soli]